MLIKKFTKIKHLNIFFIFCSLSLFLVPSVLKASTGKTPPVVCYTITNISAAQTICAGTIGSNITVKTNTNIGGAIRFVRFATDQMAGSTPTLTESNFIYSYTGAFTDIAYVTPTGSGSPYTATYTFDAKHFPNTTSAPITYYVYAVFNNGVVGSTCSTNPALEVKITVNPKPTISAIQDMYLCKGSASTAVTLMGSGVSGTTYSWTNNNTSVGLTASGSTTVPSFTAANTGTAPITATVTATATANSCVSLAQTFNIVVSPTSTSLISGFAFKDFNENGIKESAESAQSGIIVHVYDCNGTLKGSSTTDAMGFWSVSSLSFGGATDKYRVEFSIPSALSSTGLQPAMTGTNSKSDVQFVSATSCNINFGVNNPDAYCQTNPFLATPCYTNGSRGSNGSEAAVILYRYNDRGQSVPHDAIATVAEVGSVWGETYNPVNKKLYLSAFVKRHVDLPPNGLGAIYEIDLTTPTAAGAGTPTLWLDINAATFVDQTNTPVNLGFPADPGITTRNLGIKTNPSRDNWAFGNVGTEGMGDIELSQDGKRLYVMDLRNRQVLCIDYATKKLIWKLAVSTPICLGGSSDIRPWALKEHNGVLYVGVVCSGETNKNDAQLHYYVMKCNSLTAATSMSLALDLGNSVTKQTGNFWWHWSNDPTEAGLGLTTLGNGAFVIHGEPLISDIEFDKDENMIVGVMDRIGHQFGINNYIPAVTNTNLVTNIAVGDITRGVLSGSTYTGETAPWAFFYLRAGIPNPPDDQFLGGMVTTSLSGTNQVVAQMIDPFSYNSNGVTWLKTSDGQQETGIDITSRLEIVAESSNVSTFGKANGLGDLTMLCAATPIQIGNYVWLDTDKDGVQDPCEGPLSNITVSLWKSGTQIASAVTDANGNYYFSNKNASGVTWTGTGADTTILASTAYEIRIDTTNQTKLDTLKLTAANATTNSGDDQNDSDASVTGNYAVITLTTGTAGYVNHTYDFGFSPCATIVLPSTDTTICSGTSVDIRATLTNINTENIKYVYFTSHQTDPAVIYGGTGTTLGTVLNANLTSTKTVSTLSNVSFPDNNTAIAITYHVYSIIDPDPTAGGCRAFSERHYIVSPKLLSTSTVVDTATCNNGISNSDAAIAIRGITGMAKYAYGINGTTGLYAAGAIASTADSIRLSGLANPSVSTTYTFRLYGSDTTCYMDVTAVLNPSSCPCSKIVMSPIPLPAGKVGEPYSTQIVATGGTSPYHFVFRAGTSGVLPQGLTMSATGLISGTPTTSGSYEVIIVVDDAHACTDSLDPAVLTILECSLTANFTQNTCHNNGTTAIKTDDYFTVTVSATSTNGGTSGKYEVVLNGVVLNIGGTSYGTSVTVGGLGVFAADGATTYSLTVRDLDIHSCTSTTYVTTATQNCSVIPCPPKICLPVTVTRIN